MSKLARTTLLLMVVTVLSKIFGFAREVALTYVYGPSAVADAYIIAMSIPTILFTSIGAALGTTFLPLFYEIDKIEGRKKSLEFTNNVFNIIILIGMMISISGFIFTEPLVKLFAMDFTGERLRLTIEFTRIMIFGVIFIGLSNLISTWLQINGSFNIPGMVAYPFNILIILSILISSKGNVKILAIGSLIAMISQFIFQVPFGIKKGYKYKPYINLKDNYLKKMMWMIVPVFIGVGFNQINMIIDRSLASTLGNGVITVLNSASRLNGFVLGIFISTIATVLYPTLSKLSSENSKKKFTQSVAKSVNVVIILIIPMSVGAIVLSNPIVKLVFQRGAFDAEAASMAAKSLAYYSVGLIGFGLIDVLGKIFYSLQDTKTPMLNNAIAMVINIILNLILIKVMGYAGIAFATSIASIIGILLLFKGLKKKIYYFGQDKIIKTFVKVFISSLIMGVMTFIAYKFTSSMLGTKTISEILALIISIGIGAIVYACLLSILKIDEVEEVKNKIKIYFTMNIN